MLKIGRRDIEDVTVLSIRGEFASLSLREEYVAMIESLLREGRIMVLLDLSELDYINSSGLGELIRSYKKITDYRGRLKILNPKPPIVELFEMVELAFTFEKFYDETEALRSFSTDQWK